MGKDDRKEYSVDDILAEQRQRRELGEGPLLPEEQAILEQAEAQASGEEAPREETAQEGPVREEDPRLAGDTADLNAFATGNFPRQGRREEPASGREDPGERDKKKKKKRGGLFGRKKRAPDFDEGEDMYYGIQLKPIDEYRKGYDPATGELSVPADSFKALFDDQAIDEEVEANFQKLQRERRRRVAQAVQSAGVDEQQIADEFGIVAPMPVTAFAADPYARQHGIDVEGGPSSGEELPEIQKAMLETSGDKTMEMKLNVLNETVELQRVKEVPTVSEETVSRILDSVPEKEEEPSSSREEEAAAVPAGEEAAPQPSEPSGPDVQEEYEDLSSHTGGEAPAAGSEEIITQNRPLGEIPQVASIYEYRTRGIPTHVINADVLQSALLSESEGLLGTEEPAEEIRASRQRVHNPKLQEEPEEEPVWEQEDGPGESIDDYTGPEDAKSISHELRGEMHQLTMRMLITGVCTVLLALINMIFRGKFAATPAGDLGSMPVVYLVLTLIFLCVSIGVCLSSVRNGLKELFSFGANSNSATAVAAAAVIIQTAASLFFTSELADGKLHLYAVVLTAILFVNSAGKLSMIRRIHSNFRFVSSREEKYSVRIFDDYNTALKMTKDCVAEKPVIAYQCRAGFLKRFLAVSYDPDPAESASQVMAPLGLIASLVLCIACLLITRSVPTALSAFAASCCACVAVGNTLAINLPVSRLCKTARRAGAMVAGHSAVEELGSVNAVLVDAEDLFPLGTVVLGGIKTFGNRAGAEEAIMAASALMKEIGGPLSGVFDQVISENEDALPRVEEFSYEDGHGIVGRVDGKQICIGNRALLVNHRIEPPAREEETQYASGNKQVVFLAVEDTVSAMLVVTYSADRRRKNELQRLEESGVSVVVRTTDMNVTPQLISRLYGIDTASVGVLEGQVNEEAHSLMNRNVPRADAKVATKGRIESLMSVICACVAEKRASRLVVAVQAAAVALGFVMVAFLACFNGMKQLTSFVLFVFELFWLVIIILIPKLRRP